MRNQVIVSAIKFGKKSFTKFMLQIALLLLSLAVNVLLQVLKLRAAFGSIIS